MIVVETIMGEDIDLGIGDTTKTHPGGGTLLGTQVSLSTLATCGAAGGAAAKEWTPGTVASGSQSTTTIDVQGAELGDKVEVSLTSLTTDDLILVGRVRASNEVGVILANLTGASVSIPLGVLSALVFRHRTVTPIPEV